MENNLQNQNIEGERKLKELIQKKESVEAVLLQYQSGIIDGHQLCESYHNLSRFIEDFSIFLRKFREDLEKPRGIGGNRDAQYYQGRKLHEQILSQITKVQDLSSRVKHEMSNIKSMPQNKTWEKFDDGNSKHDPLVDFSTSSSLQLHSEENETAHQKQQLQESKHQIQDEEQTLQDMQQIETDMLKINEMFTSLAGFVHEQGELTDRIETNIEVAYSQVESGNEQLGRAVGHRRKITKKKIIIGAVVTGVVLLLILIIYVSTKD